MTPVLTVHEYRSIPTPVGNTSEASGAAQSKSVHPHACGEHPATQAAHRTLAGPSPRLWGTRGLLGAR
ncbi:hypothetical protein DGo_PE0030 (plasmid) [Deinococcus gobiensis I-0]|uniref:Uncharacterized protein n=1 Tax=Deinococcus gobiensis (strain DSM 21396 / JCM 16679 / CGMCC 1.7299 / I-0) TaxID=745776 RepID=H8H3S7_DEIGI|nr:hypothetical protein DGo_PE0030 [Deinococcus gobiensis I-0]